MAILFYFDNEQAVKFEMLEYVCACKESAQSLELLKRQKHLWLTDITMSTSLVKNVATFILVHT